MARNETVLNVLIASPGDVNEERVIIQKVIDEINVFWAKNKNIRLAPLCWEKNSYPDIGDDPQDVINKQFKDDYDIFIGVLWKRFGTPTGRANSGTEEEFDRAYAKYLKNPSSIKIMLYFKQSPISPNEIDPGQLRLINNFKAKIKQNQLFFEFNQPDDFRTLIHRHLLQHLNDWGSHWGNVEKDDSDPIFGKPTQEHSIFQYFNDEDGYFDIVEKTRLGIANGKKSVFKILELLTDYCQKLSDNIDAQKKYKAANNKVNEGYIINNVNGVSTDMDQLREGLEIELPIFEENTKIFIEGIRYATLFLLDSKFLSPKSLEPIVKLLDSNKSVFFDLLPAIENARLFFNSQKKYTSKFNKANKLLISTLEKFYGKTIELKTTTTFVENELKAIYSKPHGINH